VLNQADPTSDNASGSATLDDLDLAYLKARSAQGKLNDEEISVALDALLENRQFDKLNELLADNPGIELSDQQNYRRELETAVTAYREVLGEPGGEPGDNSATLQLVNTLALIRTESGLQTASLLKRARAISRLW